MCVVICGGCSVVYVVIRWYVSRGGVVCVVCVVM